MIGAPPKPEKRGPKPKVRLRRTSSPRRESGTKLRKAAPRKQRKTTLAGLKRKLWALFSAYVKARDGATCVTCGKAGLEGAQLQAGHWISRARHSTIFHPLNCASQCNVCNLYGRGKPAEFAVYLLDKYGEAQVRSLVSRSNQLHAWKKPQLETLIAAIQKSGADYECAYAEMGLW